MIAEYSQLTFQQIQQIRSTVNIIIQTNHPSPNPLPPQDTHSDYNAEDCWMGAPQDKQTMVLKLSELLINILEDASRLLEDNSSLRNRNFELIEGIQAVELDYYELREQNEHIREMISASALKIETLTKQKDSLMQKNIKVSEQFCKQNTALENQVAFLKRQLAENSFTRREMAQQLDNEHLHFYQEQNNKLKEQIVQLRSKCYSYKLRSEELENKLERAEKTVEQFELLREKYLEKSKKQNEFYTCQDVSKDLSNSALFLGSNLRFELENISSFYNEGQLCCHEGRNQPRSISHINNNILDGEVSNVTGGNGTSIDHDLSAQRPICIEPQKEKEIITANTLQEQTSFSKDAQEKKPQSNQAVEHLKEQQPLTLNQPLPSPLLLQQQQVSSGKIHKKQSLDRMVSELESESQERQKQQEKQEEQEQIFKGQSLAKIVDEIERKSGIREEEDYHSKFKKTMGEQKSLKLSRARSLKNILINSGTRDSQHKEKLYKKYRGQFQQKYPHLKKFTNKVLLRKAEIIEQGQGASSSSKKTVPGRDGHDGHDHGKK